MHKSPQSFTEQANKVAAMYIKAAELGRGFQILSHAGIHAGEWVNSDYGPNMNSDLSSWRIAPRYERIWYTEITHDSGTIQTTTTKENEAQSWRDQGYEVFEYRVN